MNTRAQAIGFSLLVMLLIPLQDALGQPKPEILKFEPFTWKSDPPADCPFERSKDLTGIRFLGVKSGFRYGDTWYPSWAADDKLYSPWTDGGCRRLDGSVESIWSGEGNGEFARTGQGVIEGHDPLDLKVYSLGTHVASALPYHGRYPCGSLVYRGVWYYGTYCLDPSGEAAYGPMTINWPWMGPFVGFRVSTDYGRSWKETPRTPAKPLFGETGINGYPVRIGSPHFVDFGKDMGDSPDGKAYLVAHGANPSDAKWRFWNDSWITGDEIYLLRVTPTPETINDASKYEFYAGRDAQGRPVWTGDFAKIKPLLEWNNAMGCVTVTYDAPLKKFLMAVTDGGNTCAKMATYLLESDSLTGPWKLVSYMKDFGEQAYFVNIPSKFISADGRTAWLLYSTNFAADWNGQKIGVNPPGGHYGLVLQKIELLGPSGPKEAMALLAGAPLSRPQPREPQVGDKLQPVALKQAELAGEIGRRINDLIYKNFMVLDIDGFFIAPFRARPFSDDYHYVGAGKVVDAGSLFAAYTGDPKVAERTSHLIDGIIQTRDADGYIGMFKPEPGGLQNHRNWALHEQEYLLLGLTHHALATGNDKSLRDARKLGDYVIRTFGQDPKPEEVCTAGLPEAFLLLHRATGDERYLNFAAEVRHGNSKAEVQCASLLDWKQTFDSGAAHVYVMLARCYAQTELYRWKKLPSLLEMSEYMRHELLRTGGGLNVVGSASDGEWFSYTQNGAGLIGESCVTAYLVRWLESLMRLEGDLRYGDIMERTIYNALFAAQDPAGRKIRYFTPFTGPRVYFDQDGFCCPGNFRRIMAELPQKVYYRCPDKAIAVNLYTTSQATVALDEDLSVKIFQETDYPNSGHVVFRVTPSKEAAFAVRLRIPRWCPNATVLVNDEDPVAVPAGTNPCEIRRKWKAGDTVTLELPMVWRIIKGHQLQEGKAALARGPVVYCLGTAQNEEILKKYPNFNGIVIDPALLGEPEPDRSIRPDGRKVTVKTRVEAPGAWSKGAPHLTLTFTEFIDPTGIVTYFHLLDLAKAVEDELMEDCFGDQPSF